MIEGQCEASLVMSIVSISKERDYETNEVTYVKSKKTHVTSQSVVSPKIWYSAYASIHLVRTQNFPKS